MLNVFRHVLEQCRENDAFMKNHNILLYGKSSHATKRLRFSAFLDFCVNIGTVNYRKSSHATKRFGSTSWRTE